jgi:uncharacterized membrane protein YqjE
MVGLLSEIKDQTVEFLATRIQMFISEMHENYDNSKRALVYGLVALVLLSTGYLLFTLAIVAAIAVAFWNNPYAWCFACLITALAWSTIGGFFAVAAKANFRGLTPKRTIKVIKDDRTLFERGEARAA